MEGLLGLVLTPTPPTPWPCPREPPLCRAGMRLASQRRLGQQPETTFPKHLCAMNFPHLI